ncbi:MAG TPA: lytic transglycosylase domain-containing protein [Puia sp.]|jgi:membrane-bound lytic murein transglycosylase D|nr:lytic transglycosylase domain-containing protein [Puia sp.]
MYNKRLLLLGITVIASGWMYPAKVTLSPQRQCLTDTERLASNNSLRNAANSNSGNTLQQELFMAAYVGGSNGVRLNLKALSFIQDYLEENWDELQNVRGYGRPYFNLIESILTQYGLPKELKYLAVIESNLKTSATSKVGAKGPWQLMPQTARDLGLTVNRNLDERKNYYKSTRAAAAYLRDLYNELGDWLLVIAAYNTGTVNVYRAIHRSGSRNFWDLEKFLPAESRSHVKKFIGTQYMFEGQGSVTTLTREEATEQLSGSAMYVFHRDLTAQELTSSRTIAVSGKYHSSVITKYTLLDSATFARYNPAFDKVMASSNNSYDLKLPADKMDLFVANKYDILRESAELLDAMDSSGQRIALNK